MDDEDGGAAARGVQTAVPAGGELEVRLSTGFEVEVAAMLSSLPAADEAAVAATATTTRAAPAGRQGLPVLHDAARDMVLRRELPLVCHVIDCGLDLLPLPDYYQRYRICKAHLQSPAMVVDGAVQRFCQQCGRFQGVDNFDGDKRNCRARLQQHNNRRRKVVDKADKKHRAGKREAERHRQQGQLEPHPANQSNTTFQGLAASNLGSAVRMDVNQVPLAAAGHGALASALAAAAGLSANFGPAHAAANPLQRLAGHKREFSAVHSPQHEQQQHQQHQQRRQQPLPAGLLQGALHSRPQSNEAPWLPGWVPPEAAEQESLATHHANAAAQLSAAVAGLGKLSPQASELLELVLQRAATPQADQAQAATGWLPQTPLGCQPSALPLRAAAPQLGPLAAYLSRQQQAAPGPTLAVAGLLQQQQQPSLQPQQHQQVETWKVLLQALAAEQQGQVVAQALVAPPSHQPQQQRQQQQQPEPALCGALEGEAVSRLNDLLVRVGAANSSRLSGPQQQQAVLGQHSSTPPPGQQPQQQPQQSQHRVCPAQLPSPLAAAVQPSPAFSLPALEQVSAALLAAQACPAQERQPAATTAAALQQLLAMLAFVRN